MNVSPFIAELIGTSFLIVLGQGVVANVNLKKTIGEGQNPWLLITLAWGFSVFIGVFIAGSISGAHLNPAVTIGLATAGKFSWNLVPFYFLAQLIGAMIGSCLSYIAYIDHYKLSNDEEIVRSTFCTGPAIRNFKNNFFAEILGTFVLVFCALNIVGPNIIIEGVNKLNPTDHEVIGDRVAAGTFLATIFSTKGSGKVNGVNPEHLPMELKKFQEMGAIVEFEESSISIEYQDVINSIEIATLPFPGVATDLQPIFGSALLMAEGTSILTENVYDQRFQWIPEVQRMGANIQTGWQHAMVKGVDNLSGAPVQATDIRTGASLIVAALQADGVSFISGVDHINRGYEDIVDSLSLLGSTIEYNDING